MSPDRPDIKDIFTAAIEQPVGPRREAILAASCGGDSAVRRRVDELLRAHARASEVLGLPGPAARQSAVLARTEADEAGDGPEPRRWVDPEATDGGVPPTEPDLAVNRAAPGGPLLASTHDDRRGDRDGDVLAPGTPIRYFGDYEIVRELGHGAMGVVYEARQVSLDRAVALKMIRAGLLANDEEVRRFRNEAQAAALLDHPGIVPVYEVGNYEGQDYFTMKLVPGDNLVPLLPRYRDEPRTAARLVAEAAEALAHAHARGVLHRDLKPANVVVDAEGHPHITDFGLAKRVEADVELTESGAILGTPAYMSPEQAAGRRSAVTIASDVYGLGGVLYTLLAGRAPFGGSVAATLDAVRHFAPDPPTKANACVPRDLETICLKCLEKDPGRRYATAQALADDLTRWLDGRPILARPVAPAERAIKWVRRHKGVTALAAAAAVGAIVGVSGLAWGLTTAVAARDEALRREDVALHRAYAARLNLAGRDWRDAHVAQVLGHLEATRPRDQPDLRGFEWYYLARLARPRGLVFQGHQDGVRGVAFSPDGRRIATASWDRTVRLWDAGSGRLIRTLIADARVDAVAIYPDGRRLASTGADQGIKIWDIDTGELLHAANGHRDRVFRLAIAPDGTSIATSSVDGTVRLWDGRDGSPLRTLADHRAGSFGGLAFARDGRTLAAAGGGEPTIRIWDVATGRLVRAIDDDVIVPATVDAPRSHGVGIPLKPVTFSPDGRTLASGAEDGTIRFRDAATGRLALVLRDAANLNAVTALAYSADGQRLVSTNYFAQAISVWDVATGFLVRTIKLNEDGGIPAIALAPDGTRLAACTEMNARIFDVTHDQEAVVLREGQLALSVAFAPDGSSLATALADGTITIRDGPTGQLTRTLAGHAGKVHGVAIGADGRTAASCGEDRTVRVWEIATGKALHTLRNHAGPVYEVAFSPDGRALATAGADTAIKLWDVEVGREIQTLLGHASAVNGLAFSPDGKTLVSGEVGGRAMLWEVASGRRLWEFEARPGGIHALAISPDGRRLAVSGPGSIRIFDLETRKPVQELMGHAMQQIFTVAYSPDGRRLASAGTDRTVRIWDTAFGDGVLVLRGHSAPVNAVAFAPDGSRIVSAGTDRTVRIWKADRPDDPAAARPAAAPAR